MFGRLVDETQLPIRKRRRPALSCIECRRRKIKCDRNHPCNHCKQTKNAVCVYKDLHTLPAGYPSSTSGPAVNQTHDLSIRSSLSESYQTDFSYQLPSRDLSPLSAPVLVDYSEPESNSNITALTTINDENNTSENGQDLASQIRIIDQPLPDGMKATEEEINGTRWKRALGISFSTFNDVIVEDGPKRGKLRTKFFNQNDQAPLGSISKTRFFGHSHWMNSLEQFDRICSFKDKTICLPSSNPSNGDANAEIRQLIEKCKTTARKIKAERPVQWHLNPDFKTYFPSREISDQLVQLYLRTMESHHRILHIPQFLREYEAYWKDPAKTSQASAVKIILVMAIGTCFYQGPNNDTLRADSQQWIYSAQSWVSAPFEKGRLNLPGLQIHCLLVLARQVNAIGGDVIWVAAGTLLRSAFQMGYHLDPTHFPKMSVLHCELRRRLWATVLELTIQTSLDGGMPPLITPSDYNTQPPANLNDADISESTQTMPTPKPPHIYTQTSLQINLLKSITTRLSISTLLNNFHSEPAYDTILHLSASITSACAENSLLVKSYPATSPRPTALQRNLLDIFVRRFLLAIHRPFVMKSRSDPRYYFSRKVCADTALVILSHSGRETQTPSSSSMVDGRGGEVNVMDDWSRLCAVGGGLYKEVVFHAGLLACFELITQLEEESASGLEVSRSSVAARQPLRDAVRTMEELVIKRIQLGENNVKGLLFLQAAQGQIEALEGGHDPEVAIIEAARIGARKCLELLRTRYKVPMTPSDEGVEVDGVEEVGAWQNEVVNPDATYEYDFMMQDGSPESGMSGFNFDMPDSWLFSNWSNGIL